MSGILPPTEVPDALVGERVDRAVAMLSGLSRAEAARLVDDGSVELDGAVVRRGSERLSVGSVLAVVGEVAADDTLVADPAVPVTVVYADEHVLVIDKAAGVVVHPGAGTPAGTLVQGLLERFPEIADVGDPARPGIVHRLDKGTSGLMVVARSDEAYDELVAMLAAHEVERRYLAVVRGHLEHDRGVVDAPLGRSRRHPTRQAVVEGGRSARTHYEVERRVDDPFDATVVQCRLETGRTHQIRVHLAAIGHPVLGDDRYGGAMPASAPPAIRIDRPALHAAELAFEHPVTGESLRFVADPPADLQTLLAGLSGPAPG